MRHCAIAAADLLIAGGRSGTELSPQGYGHTPRRQLGEIREAGAVIGQGCKSCIISCGQSWVLREGIPMCYLTTVCKKVSI